jgi:tight adherence protein B
MSSALVLASVVVLGLTMRTLLHGAVVRQRFLRAERQAVEILRALTAELAAGSTPLAALRAVVADLPPPVQPCLPDAAAAGDEPTAAQRLRKTDLPGLIPLAAAWQLSATTGAPLADVLARQASAASRTAEDAREVHTILAGPRTTARLLAGLPVLGLVLAASTGTRPLGFLLQAPAGRLCLLVGISLDCAGLLWIERLAR